MTEPVKIGIVVSHPIQHFCPQYVSFAENRHIRLRVFFGSALGYKKYVDANFKEEIAWSNLQLDKFDHVFLNGDEVLQADKNLDATNLGKELNEYGPHLLISYGYFQKIQRRARNWALKNKVPLAYISDGEGRQKKQSLKQFAKAFILRRYFRPIAYFLTVGDANEMYYRTYGVPYSKMLRMHFPIDIKQYRQCYTNKTALRKMIRDQYAIHDDATVISVVGKLSPWKNQDHIIDAMKLLEEEGIFLYLFILGSGEMREVWEEKARVLRHSKVYFTGFVPIEKLPGYYAATDVYVHPASVEPHSIAVSEAIYMGCPVIISNRCGSYGNSDDVQEGVNGYVYEFGNIRRLSGKIKDLVQDKKKREQFGIHSHEAAVVFQDGAHYTIIDKLIAGYKKMYSRHE